MDERSHLQNGQFWHNLSGWSSASALYSPGDGDDHYGVASIATGGGYIEQSFTVQRARLYTLHLSLKAVGSSLSAGQATVRIVDGSGATVLTQNLTGTADTWTEQTYSIGLVPGASYTLRITNVSAASTVKIDDIWLWWVPQTRAQLADKVHRKLDALATDASLSTTSSGTQTEGSYTDAVDAGLRAVGAIDAETDLPDVRYLDSSLLDSCLDAVEREMLERLARHYAVLTDIQVGERQEKLSQIAAAIGRLTGSGGGKASGKVVVRQLRRYTPDYEF